MLPSSQSTKPDNDSLLYSIDDNDIKELEVDQLDFKALLEENENFLIDYETSIKTDEGHIEQLVAEIIQDIPEKSDQSCICRTCLTPTYDTDCWKLFDNTNWLFCKELLKKLDYIAGKINYNVTLNPVVCEQCVKLIYTTYDFKKQVEAIEDRILEKAGLENTIVDLQSLLEENASEGRKKQPLTYEQGNNYQNIESAEGRESEKCTNETCDVGNNKDIQRTNESTDLQDDDQIDCDILEGEEQLSTQNHTREIVLPILSSVQDEYSATKDTEARGEIVNENQTNGAAENGEEEAEVNREQSDEAVISTANDKPTNTKKRDYPRSFDLFDEEHDRYFEKYKDRPESKLTMKWMSFAKRQPQVGTGPFLCPECGITFQNKPLYIKHLNEHKGEHLVVCAYCGKLIMQHRLRYHISVNHQAHKEECRDCGKKFHTSQHLAVHKRTMHTTEYEKHQCQICGKLLRKNSIRGHVQAHDPTKTYTCDVCGMTFKARSYWVRHKKRHSFTDGVPCSYCGKLFKCKDYLLQHVKQVHNQTDYNCTTCGKRLSNRDALRRHLKNVHAPNRTDTRKKRKPPDKQEDESGGATSSDVNHVNVSKVRIIEQDENMIVYNKIDDGEAESSTIILGKIK